MSSRLGGADTSLGVRRLSQTQLLEHYTADIVSARINHAIDGRTFSDTDSVNPDSGVSSTVSVNHLLTIHVTSYLQMWNFWCVKCFDLHFIGSKNAKLW